MTLVSFDAGETIFRQGDPSTHCYKIVSGTVEIRVSSPGVMRRERSIVVARLKAGEFLGEMSLIDKGYRSATAVAVDPTKCISYTSDEILDLLENDPQEAIAYARKLIRRVRDDNQRAFGPDRRTIYQEGRAGVPSAREQR